MPSDKPAALKKADSVLKNYGLTLTGTVDGGEFTGYGIVGRFVPKAGSLSIEIVSKPALMPWSSVDAFMKLIAKQIGLGPVRSAASMGRLEVVAGIGGVSCL